MKISAAAMEAALKDFKTLQYSTPKVSMYESYLVAKWMESSGRFPEPSVSDSNDAVSALFEVVPGATLGRICPFRYDWRVAEDSGRKTVWNNTTRGQRLATSLFEGDDIRQGLLATASTVIANALSDDRLPSREALSALLLRDRQFGEGDDWVAAEAALLTFLSITEDELYAVTEARSLAVPLLSADEWAPATISEPLAPPSSVTVAVTPAAGGGTQPEPVSIVVDDRVERMLRRAIENYPCILLVGPPGTGKGTLVRWLTGLVAANPTDFGFSADLVPDPMWRTPDESWSAFDLVGGLAPNEDAYLTWSNGLLLNAISEQRWLVLDETNRADLDKIMGPLLTWLSQQEVEVGRTRAHDGSPIQLGWSPEPASGADTPDPVTGVLTRYFAGRDWRMLGTYNPQDAQRVFRMGQALSRRFVVIPISALTPGQFESLVEDTYPDLPEDARTAIEALYSAHHAVPETLLGPAVFLRLAAYLSDVEAVGVPELVAEAYVANVGKFLSAFDDVIFEALGVRVVDDEQAMSREQWEWTTAQRLILG